MNAKTMEGLAGACTNMNLLNTPMRVFKEARRKGDMATMERALGYAGEFAQKAEEYKSKASEGMEEDAKEAREKAESEREEAVRKRKEEREKLEERIEKNRNADADTDTAEISGEGKELANDRLNLGHADTDKIRTDTVKEPVTYTKTGEAVHTEQSTAISVSI